MAKKRFNDHPFPYHAEIELEIHTLTNRGVGLGRVALPAEDSPTPPDAAAPASSGWVVMVPFALPGERVRARVFRNHKNYSEADLLEVLTQSPHRITPRCPLFGRCGGCQYQNFEYSEQLAWKRRQVEELLRHMAGIEFPVSPVIASPQQYGYRSKITPHFNNPLTRGAHASRVLTASSPTLPQDSGFPIGFLRQGTRHELLDVPRCDIATDAINARLPELRADIRARAAAGEFKRGATLLLRDAGGEVTTDYDRIINERVGDITLHFLARDFFQNNPFILSAFTGYVREQAAASGARHLVDAYCGSGLFALTAARAFERVTGIEISESSVQFARENAAANNIANATFRAGDASAIFAGLDFPPGDTVVIIDPPRKGCDENFLSQLFAYAPRAVVYVSCDPATQMRDLAHFTARGYKLTAVQPFDLFPQTRHLECVITLQAP
ncbi:tRNA/tmRNA/rRNA uracil-C5-methylase (TrmA/RlmC/RlmD family) [Ereboglobus sp. PH5-10]|uniref:class I SAM-dependent RNA methyltransferase n=1 Tax=Ereboglobus sp. PH5-10 TaxID=2940629 RepID=UPI002405B6AE|nr:class I SAM-dependent RNA methyltransferase [Ereboglobus sp. PH5-10]MDF9827179.1 tRNA/tmRNA/rRNA uracil-C5-methylase (TrmA/RlmC/RlmD family) [Ereboglobus sp. PH5-10]